MNTSFDSNLFVFLQNIQKQMIYYKELARLLGTSEHVSNLTFFKDKHEHWPQFLFS